jgi:uncharacterized protein YgfB (UPF0149 family)
MKYSHFQSALAAQSDGYHAAQWHGVLCGLLCAGRPTSLELWHRFADELSDQAAPLITGMRADLERVYRDTSEQLEAEDVSLELLLPDDDTPLSARTEALGLWCDAFLYGLTAGGVSEDTELSVDSRELLKDLAEISRAEFSGSKVEADDELNFQELVEYIRVGVLVLNDELNPVKPDTPQIH